MTEELYSYVYYTIEPVCGVSLLRCLPFTPTLFSPTGIAYTFTFSKLHHIMRADGLMGLKFGLIKGLNHHKLTSKLTQQKLLDEKEEKNCMNI